MDLGEKIRNSSNARQHSHTQVQGVQPFPWGLYRDVTGDILPHNGESNRQETGQLIGSLVYIGSYWGFPITGGSHLEPHVTRALLCCVYVEGGSPYGTCQKIPAAGGSESQRVHVPNNKVLGFWVIVILVQVLGKYMIIGYLDP